MATVQGSGSEAKVSWLHLRGFGKRALQGLGFRGVWGIRPFRVWGIGPFRV